ncbi:MAG: archaeal proteasome endopeptidase complex subunit alpha [Candidatus Altiarchaeota archaeon]|nr:archaeal proteasome endopeptidase complex subunit alpha [Candidatus Altiarchaeota archaeon]
MYPGGQLAYDRAITVFSPDGRIFQVEYAREAVKRGTTAVGMVYNKGVLLAVDKSIEYSLLVPESIEKIYQIDEHIGAASSGLIADARRMVEEARLEAQRNRIVYDEEISVSELTRKISNTSQMYTQYGGIRPYGCALLIAGVNDSGKELFETDPSGAYSQYYATAIGSGKKEVEKFFEKNYKDNMPKEEAIAMAIEALKLVSNSGKFDTKNVNVAIVEEASRKFKQLSTREIEDICKKQPPLCEPKKTKKK